MVLLYFDCVYLKDETKILAFNNEEKKFLRGVFV
jgi:hypothetical protein